MIRTTTQLVVFIIAQAFAMMAPAIGLVLARWWTKR